MHNFKVLKRRKFNTQV